MRVRISYSVDLDDVPTECSRMVQETMAKVNGIYEELEMIVDALNTDRAVSWQVKDSIDKCRQELGKIDAMMADSDMIMQGYFSAKEPQELNQESEDVIDEG